MSGVNNSQQDVDIDLGQLFRAVWQRRIRVVAITLAGACAALVIAKLVSPEYRSETRVLIEQRAPAFATTAPGGGDAASTNVLDELNIASQVQILQSADLIKQVITDLKLYDAMVTGKYDVWKQMTLEQVEDCGGHETLNWFALMGAMQELNQKVVWSNILPTYIFNATKVTAVFGQR